MITGICERCLRLNRPAARYCATCGLRLNRALSCNRHRQARSGFSAALLITLLLTIALLTSFTSRSMRTPCAHGRRYTPATGIQRPAPPRPVWRAYKEHRPNRPEDISRTPCFIEGDSRRDQRYGNRSGRGRDRTASGQRRPCTDPR